MGGYHYEIKQILKYMLDTIIGLELQMGLASMIKGN